MPGFPAGGGAATALAYLPLDDLGGRGPNGPMPNARPIDKPQTRQDFVNLISVTDDFDKLTKDVPAMMASVSLDDANARSFSK